jgi:hypothetical protein
MPKNNKKGKQRVAEVVTAETNGDFDDMLAAIRATNLTTATANSSSSSSSSSGSTSMNISATIADPSNTISSTTNAFEISEALERGDIGQLQHWGRQGLRVTSSEPLAYAAEEGQLDMVQCLVKELGANVDQADHGGCTALHQAAAAGHIAVV